MLFTNRSKLVQSSTNGNEAWTMTSGKPRETEEADRERPLTGDGAPFEVPVWFRWAASAVALLLIVPSVLFLVRYSLAPNRFASPSDLGIIQLILVGTAILLCALAPWKALGLRLRKVGIVEFDRVISGQAAEHAEELTELRTRIDEMESTQRRLDDISPISEHLEDVALIPLVTKFLHEHRPTPYSPLRIREWGSRQPGYEQLAHAKLASIRRILQKLVSEGQAATRVSQLGNTLYKVPD